VGAPSPIQFNPVIKIVNGDDNSRNQGEQKPTTTHSDFDETTYTESSKPIVFKKDGGSSHSENTQTPASNSSSGGFLDGVKNFFIKKIG
jgi:hypothetical protein